MFNTTQDISITLKTPSGVNEVVVTFPTDEQWTRRTAKTKIQTRQLGRGKSRDEASRAEVHNAELFDQIVTNDVELDVYEKSTVIERLNRSEVVDSFIAGEDFVVHLKVPGGVTVHKLSRPSEKQKKEYRDSTFNFTSGRHGTTETTINLGASDTLYNSLVKESTGYAEGTPTPIIHKSAVIDEVLSLLREDDYEGDIEGF